MFSVLGNINNQVATNLDFLVCKTRCKQAKENLH